MSNSIGEILQKMGALYDVDLPEMTREEWQQKKIDDYNATAGNLNEVDGYNCDLCKNKGHILVLDENYTELYRECKCMKTRATLQRAKRSGLGDILTDFTFDKYIVTEDWQGNIKETAQAFCTDDSAKWFYIGGQSGAGKTHLCTAIAAHHIKAGYEVKYMIWIAEAKKLKALVNDASYQQEINKYKDVDVLYIDDFLKVDDNERPTGADMKLALEIINHRLLSKDKVTIISSERPINELIDYDEATMGRLFQQTGNYKISIQKDRSRNYRLRG